MTYKSSRTLFQSGAWRNMHTAAVYLQPSAARLCHLHAMPLPSCS